MPSSTLKRSPASTFSAIGFNRWSVILSSLISNPSKASNAPNCCRSAPEQQEQHTNIAVHGEKRSVQLAQIVRFDERMLVGQQRSNNGDACPRRPWQSKTERQPPEKRNHANVHPSRNHERIGDPEFFRHGKKPRALIVVDVLTRVEHGKSTGPQRNCSAKDQHAPIETAGDGDPCGSRRDAQGKSEKEMRPVGEPLGEGIEKKNRDGQRRKLQRKRIELPRGEKKRGDCAEPQKPRKLHRDTTSRHPAL